MIEQKCVICLNSNRYVKSPSPLLGIYFSSLSEIFVFIVISYPYLKILLLSHSYQEFLLLSYSANFIYN